MTVGMLVVLGLGLAAASPGWAQEPKALIDKAIQAAGGADKLEKYKAAVWKGRGKAYAMGLEIPYTGEWTEQFPNQFKFTIEGDVMGQKFTIGSVVNGDKGWLKVGDDTQEMDKDRLTEAREDLHANWVGRLVPLKDKAFTLAPLGEVKVEDKPALGVKVTYPNRRDVNLFFDKESGLLVKIEHRVKDEQSGMDMNQEVFMSDFKEVEGIKMSMKFVIKRDGKPFVDGEITEYKLEEKLDDSVFAKP
jgi:hypothetical protein